jgi:hypothetical protein
MGLFTRQKETSGAEQSLARLQERAGRQREPEIYVTVMDPPPATTPGAPLPCYNEGDPVRVGDEVLVLGSLFVDQPGRIMAGALVVTTHRSDEQTTSRRVLAVEPMGEELGLVIEGRAADRYLYGDQVSQTTAEF